MTNMIKYWLHNSTHEPKQLIHYESSFGSRSTEVGRARARPTPTERRTIWKHQNGIQKSKNKNRLDELWTPEGRKGLVSNIQTSRNKSKNKVGLESIKKKNQIQ